MSFNKERVIEANQEITRYQFISEYAHKLIYKGEADFASGAQHILLGIDRETFPEAEVFWQANRGIGRKLSKEVWFPLRGRPAPNYLELTLEFLRDNEPVATREENELWELEFTPENVPIRENPRAFFENLFVNPCNDKSQPFIERAVEMAASLQMRLVLRISRESLLVKEVVSLAEAEDKKFSLSLTFVPLTTPVAPFPEGVKVLSGPDIPAEMLLFKLGKPGGWMDSKTHSPWAQRSIELIKDKDIHNKKYEEIYDSTWFTESFHEQDARASEAKPYPTNEGGGSKHHPIVVGACYEDETNKYPDFYQDWFSHDPDILANPNFRGCYGRDYHHYGGDEKGLKDQWFFYFDHRCGGDPEPTVGDRFYSARDWGLRW